MKMLARALYRLVTGDEIEKIYDSTSGSTPRSGNDKEVDDISIYPNPVSNILHVELPIFIDNQSYTMQIWSASGALVKEVVLSQRNMDINTDDMRPGVYFYQIRSGDNIINTNKLIKL